MNNIPENVRQDLIKYVPHSIVNEICCFTFYDNHPRSEISIDIIICTCRGELKEYNQREVVYSTLLDICTNPTEIRILRNSKCEVFYVVAAGEEIIVLRRKDKLEVVQRVSSVDRYEIEDAMCRGQACLKVIRNDDAVPLMFDENFTNIGDSGVSLNQPNADESLPVVTQLMRKLTEAKYTVKCNEKAYKDLLSLRQLATFSEHKKSRLESNYTLLNESKEVAGTLILKSPKPWVRLCNKKVIILLDVINNGGGPVENVNILLHRNARPSINYTTKIFQKTLKSPHWIENHTQNIKPNCETSMVVVIDLRELKYNVTSKINFCGVICYKYEKKDYLLPFENTIISALDTMGEKFDVLANDNHLEIEEKVILAMLSSSQKIELCLRHIKNDYEIDIDIFDILCQYLKMDKIAINMIIHRKWPYHILHGIMIVVKECIVKISNRLEITLHMRSSSQVLAFIHYIQDAVPHRLIITKMSQKITAKMDDLTKYNEETEVPQKTVNHIQYGTSILNQTSTILQYFDYCMIKMNASKNPVVQNKVGTEIDLFAGDHSDYVAFRKKLLEQATRGIYSGETNADSSELTECMVIDSD